MVHRLSSLFAYRRPLLRSADMWNWVGYWCSIHYLPSRPLSARIIVCLPNISWTKVTMISAAKSSSLLNRRSSYFDCELAFQCFKKVSRSWWYYGYYRCYYWRRQPWNATSSRVGGESWPFQFSARLPLFSVDKWSTFSLSTAPKKHLHPAADAIYPSTPLDGSGGSLRSSSFWILWRPFLAQLEIIRLLRKDWAPFDLIHINLEIPRRRFSGLCFEYCCFHISDRLPYSPLLSLERDSWGFFARIQILDGRRILEI